jgi:hypothetical protein
LLDLLLVFLSISQYRRLWKRAIHILLTVIQQGNFLSICLILERKLVTLCFRSIASQSDTYLYQKRGQGHSKPPKKSKFDYKKAGEMKNHIDELRISQASYRNDPREYAYFQKEINEAQKKLDDYTQGRKRSV